MGRGEMPVLISADEGSGMCAGGVCSRDERGPERGSRDGAFSQRHIWSERFSG
jgi:hypothetical protein